MKRIELGENSYAELKSGVTFGCLLEATDASTDGKQSAPLLVILGDLVATLVIEGKNVERKDIVVQLKALDAVKALPLMTEASKILEEGFGGAGALEKKE
jgi:hypothetical protein